MTEKLWTVRSVLGEITLEKKTSVNVQLQTKSHIYTSHGLFHSGSSSLWYCVPELWSTEMNVIDTEEIHIFDVPCKSGPPHAKVEVRSVHSWKALIGRRQ